MKFYLIRFYIFRQIKEKIMKKGLIGLAVIAVLSIGGYFWYQDYQAEQNRLRKESYEAMIQIMANAPREAEEARIRYRKELEERRQRIEAGTAKVEEINEVRKDGRRVLYTLVDGKREGDFFIWYKSGRKSTQATYKDGKSIVSTSFYDIEGSPKKSEEYNGPDSKSENFGWYANGQLESQDYTPEDGDIKGKWSKSWYEDGTVRGESKYNPETGFVDKISYYPDGKVSIFLSNGFGDKGMPIEIRKLWYPNGQPKVEENTRGNRPDGRVYEWDENGNLITNEFWVDGYLDREQSDPKMIRSNYK